MKPMTIEQQTRHARAVDTLAAVARALDGLPPAVAADEDIAVARARIENWLTENEGRWAA